MYSKTYGEWKLTYEVSRWYKILRNPNVWNGDTAATCDIQFRESGMTNTKTPKEYRWVVAYNDKNEKPEIIGIITAN